MKPVRKLMPRTKPETPRQAVLDHATTQLLAAVINLRNAATDFDLISLKLEKRKAEIYAEEIERFARFFVPGQ